jgi:hypothetical protein
MRREAVGFPSMIRRTSTRNLLMLRARCVSVASILLMACATAGGEGIHASGNYATKITPVPGLGEFQLQHDPDRPILGYYGGIGLYLDEKGQWEDFWVTRKADVDYLIKRCREFGMNRIYANMMLQESHSELLGHLPIPQSSETTALFGYAIEQAHINNIQVYVDIPVFGRRERDEPFVQANSEDIFARRADGSVNTTFFSPANPKVRAYRIAVLLEVLSHYPVDGIQLDFIRWESDTKEIRDLAHEASVYGYEKSFLKEFRQEHNLPADFVPQPDDPRFIQARADRVTLFIEELCAALKRSGVSLPIGVYNSNSYGREASLRNVCQDWKTWEERALVDEHHPMFYMDDLTRLANSLQSILDVKREGSTVFGPIFLDGPGPFDPERVEEVAGSMINLGCDGIWFCREAEIEQMNLWPTVKRISEMSLGEIRADQ